MLLGVPMSELSEIVVPLDDVLGAEASLLVEQLFLAGDWRRRFELLDSFLVARLEGARKRPSPDAVWAWQRLVETAGKLPVERLAAELSCSRRHLTRRFREQIGPAPKAAARILRFQSAARQLAVDDGRRFADIAHDCGYFDQAHLNRDFRELSGTTPGAFLATRLPGPLGVAA
jgi:AraC-like DNA-binding protein